MSGVAQGRAPAAKANKVRRQRVANRNQKERIRELEAELARMRTGCERLVTNARTAFWDEDRCIQPNELQRVLDGEVLT